MQACGPIENRASPFGTLGISGAHSNGKPNAKRIQSAPHLSGGAVFNQADQDDPDKPTTLSLRDDPEPALQKAREQALRERYSGPIRGAIGGIGLVVVLALLYVVFNDYVAHKQELPALIARGRRIPAQLSGEPVRVGLRYRYTAEWRVE